MAFKSLLSVVTDAELSRHTLNYAQAFGVAQDAHLEVLCFGVDRSQTGYYYAGANAVVLQETLTRATTEAAELAGVAKASLANSDVRWGVSEGVAQLVDISRHVAGHARFADLVVLPKPYGPDRGVELEPVLEAALFEGQSSVIVLPDEEGFSVTPRRVVIGWNESAEALRAVRAALPILKQADAVHVVVVDPAQHGPNRSDPGGLLSQYLARHGVTVEVDVLSKTLPRISDVLQRHVVDVNADMVVMGAYGHSRFREAILGGATRNMLEHAKVPVFMTH